MVFRTEFTISMQSGREEEVYFDKLHEVLSSIVPDENRVKGKLFEVTYITTRKANYVSFAWKLNKTALDTANWEPTGAQKNVSREDAIYMEYIKHMETALKKIKWLKRHNIRDVATVWM